MGESVVHQKDNFLIYKFNLILSKFSGNSKKHKLEKDRENLNEVLGKFYFRLDKLLNKICKISKQILQRLEFL